MKKIDENYEFARFLKANADDQELDEDFNRLQKNILPTMTVQNVENVVKNYMQNFKEMK